MTEEGLVEVIEASPVPKELEVTSAYGQEMGADNIDKILVLSTKLKKLIKGIMNKI